MLECDVAACMSFTLPFPGDTVFAVLLMILFLIVIVRLVVRLLDVLPGL